MKVLLVTNDFPPRPGGIQSFLHGLVSRLDPAEVVVYTSRWRDWQEWDAAQPFAVVREETSVLLPTPPVRRRAVSLLSEHGCDSEQPRRTQERGGVRHLRDRARDHRSADGADVGGHRVRRASCPALQETGSQGPPNCSGGWTAGRDDPGSATVSPDLRLNGLSRPENG